MVYATMGGDIIVEAPFYLDESSLAFIVCLLQSNLTVNNLPHPLNVEDPK